MENNVSSVIFPPLDHALVEYTESIRKKLMDIFLKVPKKYNSVDEYLDKELKEGADLSFNDWRNKSEDDFIYDGIRGNINYAKGSIITYAEGDKIIEEAIHLDLDLK